MEQRIVAVDFDGTLCEHRYPDVGEEVPGAFDTLRELSKHHRLILWTMRHSHRLKDAVDWCRARGIEFWGVNKNPEQRKWTGSPKAYAHVYIDDAALGCPLVHPASGARPYVDWSKVAERLRNDGYL